MKIIKCHNYQEMCLCAAGIISEEIISCPSALLGLATGSTPVGIYKELVRRFNKGELDFSRIRTVNLDEYVGISPENPQSYRFFMDNNLFNLVNIDKANTHIPDGMETDPHKACRDYDEILDREGKTDIQLLGIGRNGHIGFNEPSDSFYPRTSCVKLAKSTIEANSRFFENSGHMPEQAYTMGFYDIINAKKIILAAYGKGKAEILNRALTGPITPQVPASILQLHPNLTVCLDEQAAALTTA